MMQLKPEDISVEKLTEFLSASRLNSTGDINYPYVGFILTKDPNIKDPNICIYKPSLLSLEKITLNGIKCKEYKKNPVPEEYPKLYILKSLETVFNLPSLRTTSSKLKEVSFIFYGNHFDIISSFYSGASNEDRAKTKQFFESDIIETSSYIWISMLIKEIETLQKEEDLRKRETEVIRREKKFNEVEKKGKFRRSGHLTDQILKYNYPKDRQLSLFDNLKSETLKDIEVAGIEVAQIVEGIKLSPSETKVIDCLCKLLHETSQISDAKKEDYYSGNIGYELVEYGGDKNTPAPKLAFALYELTREYKGGEYVAGKDIENVKQILTELDSKRFLLSYVETTRKKDGGRIERKIEDFRKLIHIVKISQTEFNKEDIELSKKEETVILLNPIFRRQIDSKFILYPNDITRRTIIAYGSHNLSDIALRLRDYLIRELSSKRYQPEINLDKLYYLLAEKWMKESRKTKVKQYTEKALETVKALGLLLSYEIKTGVTGEPKVVFTLNKDWE